MVSKSIIVFTYYLDTFRTLFVSFYFALFQYFHDNIKIYTKFRDVGRSGDLRSLLMDNFHVFEVVVVVYISLTNGYAYMNNCQNHYRAAILNLFEQC